MRVMRKIRSKEQRAKSKEPRALGFASATKTETRRRAAKLGEWVSELVGEWVRIFSHSLTYPLTHSLQRCALIALLIFHTSSVWSATISGRVGIEGRKDLSGVLVTVQGKNLSGVTSDDGTYSISNVSSGSFTLIAQKVGCLVAMRSDVVVRDELSDQPPGQNYAHQRVAS
jgi:hypothetical protein